MTVSGSSCPGEAVVSCYAGEHPTSQHAQGAVELDQMPHLANHLLSAHSLNWWMPGLQASGNTDNCKHVALIVNAVDVHRAFVRATRSPGGTAIPGRPGSKAKQLCKVLYRSNRMAVPCSHGCGYGEPYDVVLARGSPKAYLIRTMTQKVLPCLAVASLEAGTWHSIPGSIPV